MKKVRLMFNVDIYSCKEIDINNESLLNYLKKSVLMQQKVFNGEEFEPTFLIDNAKLHMIVMDNEKHEEFL
jgi:hypothetical protein